MVWATGNLADVVFFVGADVWWGMGGAFFISGGDDV